MMWDNVKKQEFLGCCTKCAHKRSQDYRRLQAQDLIDRFTQYGYKVLTPPDKIKPRGKGETLNKAVVLIEDKMGYQFYICYNNFSNRLDRYIELNEDNNIYFQKKHLCEETVGDFLKSVDVPFKREFVINEFRGAKKHHFRFDFCLFFTEKDKWLMVEIDEPHHSQLKVKKRDAQKDYYCQTHNIPLLRIDSSFVIDSEKYKNKITEFILSHKK